VDQDKGEKASWNDDVAAKIADARDA